MPNLKDFSIEKEDLKLKILGWGQSGSGKTRFFKDWPAPRYLFDFDNGALTLRGCDIEFDLYNDVWNRLHGTRKLTNSSWDQFEKKLQEFSSDLPYASVCVDSLTTMEMSILAKMIDLSGKSIPTLPMYNELCTIMERLTLSIKRLSCNVYVIAHEMLIQDEVSGRLVYRPAITGRKTPERIPCFFDEVYHFDVAVNKEGEETYRIQTKKSPLYFAKSRWGCLDMYEEPNFLTLYEKIYQDSKEKKGEN